jgi:hypothetical protein
LYFTALGLGLLAILHYFFSSMPYLGVELIPMLDIVPNVVPAFLLSLFHHSSCSAIIDPLAVCIDILVTGPPSCILLSPQPHPEDLLAIIVPPAFL